MRNLTITRNKTFVGCLGTMKVYIEDPIMGDTTIGEVRCKKLGDLKNGETKTFSIEETEARIYVIADKISKNYCNDFCTVPAGNADVFLTGQNRYNPANGHAFQFDGQADEATLQNRRKNTTRGVIILVAALIIGVVIGVASVLLDKPEPKTFELDMGAQITLTDEFEIDTEEYDLVVFSSYDNLVAIYKYGFDESPIPTFPNLTHKEYGEFVIEMFELEDVGMKVKDGVWYFEYEETSEGDELYSLHVIFKGDDAFWSVEFTCYADEQSKWVDQFWEWADTFEMK